MEEVCVFIVDNGLEVVLVKYNDLDVMFLLIIYELKDLDKMLYLDFKSMEWKKGVMLQFEFNLQVQKFKIVKIEDLLEFWMKMFDEVCGYVVVDYQDYLEV